MSAIAKRIFSEPEPKSYYWGGTGTHNHVIDALTALLPESGSCNKPRSKNKALDKFRRAMNLYFDLYNNGLANREFMFRKMFGSYPTCASIEAEMDKIIKAACEEQGVAL